MVDVVGGIKATQWMMEGLFMCVGDDGAFYLLLENVIPNPTRSHVKRWPKWRDPGLMKPFWREREFLAGERVFPSIHRIIASTSIIHRIEHRSAASIPYYRLILSIRIPINKRVIRHNTTQYHDILLYPIDNESLCRT